MLIEPKNCFVSNLLGVINSKDLNKYDIAIRYFTLAIENCPEGSLVEKAGYLNNRGLARKYIWQYDQAKQDFLEAVKLNPKLSQGYNNLGLMDYEIYKDYE